VCVCVCLRAGVLVMGNRRERRKNGRSAREKPDVTSAIVEINKRVVLFRCGSYFPSFFPPYFLYFHSLIVFPFWFF
jgi:hypothetical protein